MTIALTTNWINRLKVYDKTMTNTQENGYIPGDPVHLAHLQGAAAFPPYMHTFRCKFVATCSHLKMNQLEVLNPMRVDAWNFSSESNYILNGRRGHSFLESRKKKGATHLTRVNTPHF